MGFVWALIAGTEKGFGNSNSLETQFQNDDNVPHVFLIDLLDNFLGVTLVVAIWVIFSVYEDHGIAIFQLRI